MNKQLTDYLEILSDYSFEQKTITMSDVPILEYRVEDIPVEWQDIDLEESDSPSYYELHGCSSYEELEDFLTKYFREFKISFIANNFDTNETLKQEYISQVNEFREELSNTTLFHAMLLKDMSFVSLVKTKIRFCEYTVDFIEKQGQKKKTHKATNYNNLNQLKQKEVVILFHHLRELGLIAKGIPNNVYNQYISDLTGYAAEKIRQDLSNVSKESTSVDSNRFQESDYEGVIRVIKRKLLHKIEAEYKDKYKS